MHVLTPAPARGALTVLALGAHSDDIEIGCGGTLLQLLAARRVHMHWVVLSASAARAAEAHASARALLKRARRSEVQVEAFHDGHFPAQFTDIKACFEALKRRVRPDVIFTHHSADRHQDHRLTCELTWNTFRDHLVLEYEVPKYDGGLTTPNHYVPIAAATVRRKLAHLRRAFPSQRSKRWWNDETFRALLSLRGVECASPTGYAEGFHAPKVQVQW